jgi:hypothetical protein
VSKVRELKNQIMEEGVDMQIDDADWRRIRELLPPDGDPGIEDLQTLVELRTEARAVCPAFDAYFFPVFKAALLTDGRISASENFQLLRMLYGGGGIDAAERRFLNELRQDLREKTPEFEALYQQAMKD